MRMSSNSDDAGYDAWLNAMAEGKTVTVFLDGTEQNECFMADTDSGEVGVFLKGDDGQLVVDGDELVAANLTGKVEIVVGEVGSLNSSSNILAELISERQSIE